ncbi:MAG: HAD family hydrolase [Marinomonas foliarum]|uniref:HAD family phosphatase n=1 Tax=Marinomonas foliarum TaxID=491950 RepID=A0A368ZW64_9GAMM|nr:HAD family phosphatase [Marinomonas foliarum]QRV23796.1 HAD family phosphatase [Marinomonas foliarum]RCX01262.1 HAD superfamily hydrolase (TIGR01509 family) [Marinomonas foliarum]
MTYSYKAIIFDCDGVIVDTETISNTILKSMLSECGLELDDETLHAKFTGFTNQENLINAEKLLGRPLPANFDEDYRQRFHAVIEADLDPIKGVRDLLNKITMPIAMATNARRKEMDFKLNKIQLAERFSTRFCVEDVENGKPAPDLYLKAAKALNVAPEDCLVIEDSIAGITAGRAAGMRVLAFSETLDANMQTAAGATECFHTMKELEGLLGI